ncbi:MAG: pyruvate dehydrogenase (acetyl-transferring), homodimeric type [Polyangiaceae bacterium]|jgi:pyruvate dehydrogenase E1 component|nr:pyruvate dehydrogenase (acetyl-transferring), homodimeric type [Polyangiaceae bacterium]
MLIDAISQIPDADPVQTREWIESIRDVIAVQGPTRARLLTLRLLQHARALGVDLPVLVQTDYINTIPADQQPPYPGDEVLEKRIRRLIRWNAVVMVVRANASNPGIGGHLATYASAASLYEAGFHHFFKGLEHPLGADQVYFQGHAAPGIYARAYLEGRLTEGHLERFRREQWLGHGLSSYPHPRLMPRFWQFPTVSMGLGPICAIYQARFNRYLEARGFKRTADSKVWAFVGDGETDEPEALGALSLAGRERLDNLIFVVNCNLQRLDGPVRGNGKIIQELETVFRGAGWNVIKVVWGREWDPLLAGDRHHLLLQRMNETVDGQFQKYAVETGDYIRADFFGKDQRLLDLVAHLSDDELRRLRRGGHDLHKVYAAYRAAAEHTGAPTVILAQTVKGWALGEGVEAKNVTHQQKKLGQEELRVFRNRLELDIPDRQLKDPPFFHPGMDSEEVQYMLERRRALGGFLPQRASRSRPLPMPDAERDPFTEFFAGSHQEVSTTMAFARMLSKLLRDKQVGKRVVPIIPDEARTFGMDPLFSQIGIYAPFGQLYEPVDSAVMLKYRESGDGQLLEEGITEAGAIASFTAAATSYSVHGEPMVPFYMFYSMFGFQRTGDQLWALGDIRGRGFLIGGTAGRTTLMGEGLQHADGHSHLLASVNPAVRAYDPAFAFELAVIVREGMRRMFIEQQDIMFYITIHNETFVMPAMPEGVEPGIMRGLYLYRPAAEAKPLRAQLLGSGPILREALRAQQLLAESYDIAADVWSATSFLELRRDALAAERWNRLHPDQAPRRPYVVDALEATQGPIIASSDWIRGVPEQIARWLPGRFCPLGTDGFGMSDTREVMRRHFEIDAESIVVATLYEHAKAGQLDAAVVGRAIRELDIDPEKLDPASV